MTDIWKRAATRPRSSGKPDSPDEDAKHITYRELHTEVCKFANVLKAMGVGKGDRVILYMPMIPEAAYAMLACARIGAIHSIVFGGFSSDALAARINGCDAAVVVTADEAPRGGRNTPLKANADEALQESYGRRQDAGRAAHRRRCRLGRLARSLVARDGSRRSSRLPARRNERRRPAVHPLYVRLDRQPKGVVHTSGGYLVYAAMTHEYTFDYHDGDIYWCTADVGWVTGHSYIVYGPLANGATTLMFEGVPTYPDASRFWQVCEKHKVNQFYTAPTAIRALMGKGDEWVAKADLASLKLLGTVGEPINPEAWNWYHESLAEGAARSSTPGGRQKPAAT